jgi:hypothetical protein
MQFDKTRNEVGFFRQTRFIKKIIFIDRRIQQAIITGKNIMSKIFPGKPVISLGEIRLKKIRAFIYRNDIGIIAIIKWN